MPLKLSRATAAQSLLFQCQAIGLPEATTEWRFHATRRWRFDVAFVAQQFAVEIDGGVFTGGRHSRGAGYRADCEKVAEAMALGWIVLRLLPEHVESGQAVNWIEKILAWRQGP